MGPAKGVQQDEPPTLAVFLVAREQGPHDKVCGEFLSGEAARYLGALGLDLPALGAVPIVAVRLAHRATLAEVPLPFPAYSLSRRVLDEALLARAAAAGATIRRGARVAAAAPARPPPMMTASIIAAP